IHHPKGFVHPMQHRNVILFRPWHAPMHVSITVPGMKAADAEMERNIQADLVSISIPSFEMADAEMNPLNLARIHVDANYTRADAEMEFNRAADMTTISVPGFEAADAEIGGLADAGVNGSNL
ncbi:MAG: hypothetical protein MUE58_06830, partial [Chitinophagaceae bacterium]|nr:hypothetical protein [Chitinophagaceae bacterium]